jgi:hypothetical protein
MPKQKSKSKQYIPASKNCAYCEEPITGHPRCKVCKILLHERKFEYMSGAGKQFTEIGSFGRCLDCTLQAQN